MFLTSMYFLISLTRILIKMELGVLDVITILLMFISLCFAVFLFTAKKVNKLSNLLLGSFLVFTALEAGSLFIDYFIFKDFPGIGMILSYVVFLPAPILFLYIVSIIYSDFKIKRVHFWHLLPFLLVNALLIPNFYLVSYEDKLLFLKGGVEGGRLEILSSYYLAHFN